MEKRNIKIQCLQFKGGLLSKTEFFEIIWHSHGKKISFYINRLLLSGRENIEDLFQEIMIKIFNNLEQYNLLYSLDTWIYKIARHHCIDYIKKRNLPVDTDNGADIPITRDNPELQYLKDEMMKEVEEAMNSLTVNERELAFLRLHENMKFHAISEIMDENINTLKTRMKKIKDILKDELKEYYHE